MEASRFTMTTTTNQILDILKSHTRALEREFGVERIGIFGSAARDEMTNTSDVDVLVEFNRPIGLFEFVALEFHLEKLFGRRVDLATPDALKPRIRSHVSEDLRYV